LIPTVTPTPTPTLTPTPTPTQTATVLPTETATTPSQGTTVLPTKVVKPPTKSKTLPLTGLPVSTLRVLVPVALGLILTGVGLLALPRRTRVGSHL
jgi:hypothetical protein